jgi:hypothetical protein
LGCLITAIFHTQTVPGTLAINHLLILVDEKHSKNGNTWPDAQLIKYKKLDAKELLLPEHFKDKMINLCCFPRLSRYASFTPHRLHVWDKMAKSISIPFIYLYLIN